MDALPADFSDAVGRRFSEGAALALRSKLWARRQEVRKQCLAPAGDVGKGLLEIAGVPGVGNGAGMVGKVQEQAALMFRVAAQQSAHVGEVVFLHSNKQVIGGIVLTPQLHGALPGAGDAMCGQDAARAGVRRVADFFAARGGGGDEKMAGKPTLFHQVLHEKFGHRAAADIAVADKQYFYHLFISPFKSCIPSQTLDISGFSDF